MMTAKWEAVIGLEIHVQLATRSKIFSAASTAFGAEPNTQACAVDLGLPGVLPVLNSEAVRMAAMFGLAVNAKIAKRSVFARKNYFYPDLPKGYQISQYELPIVEHGQLEVVSDEGGRKIVGITRAHLEEDAGKSLHEEFSDQTGIDLNRAGTPLIEIVSEPDMRSAKEAVSYMKKIHSIVRHLEISDGNMQEGSFRCDANVSVRPAGQEALGTRTEIKNLNSFRFVERAIEFEIKRQIGVLEDGREVVQETRLYDAGEDETRPMRSKEEADDYRYFPDPDLLPVVIRSEVIEDIKRQLPELPAEKASRFRLEYGLNEQDAEILTMNKEVAEYFEQTVRKTSADARRVANWVTGELNAALSVDNLDITSSPVTSDMLAGLLTRIEDGTISGKIAKEIFRSMWAGEGEADSIIESKGLRQITDTQEIELLVDQVLLDNPVQVGQFKSGKDKVFGFFVGQVMKLSKGKANPQQVNSLLRKKLQ
ncbi:MAG: Asp-tRNA(Asn)/Glu-tRNA(Gln) amidotransferase subunit GatB [Gammaproteobacteria bacterium]|nr:Asp-tRNA(Asn)/Glu-tRNA(Gln) amidotransferase subunit GatB [Gammaproteobacteria bacterium]